ncbi:hypothetical protein BDV18DRAFT_133776 [Aspergillus unguis]
MTSSAFQAQQGYRSRRSYPSLNRISLAPLTTTYPIDDDNDSDNDPGDYFTPRNGSSSTPNQSYLSSYSVPGSPGILSHTPSRSASRTRHHSRSKSSTQIHLSDSNLQDQHASSPLHHRRGTGSGNTSANMRNRRSAVHDTRDPEWMLRAGAVLASSAREEKGQSWLVKRESSISLVSESAKYEVDTVSQALRTGTGTELSRRSKSGRSTPAAASSRSRVASRRNSRPDLSMTGLEMTMPSPISKRSSGNMSSGRRTPSSHIMPDEAQSSSSVLPDFIDEKVRAEMRDTIYQQQIDGAYDSAVSDNSWGSEDDEDEIDERALQTLTRERGFGLGSWIDRLVEWTLFGVDDWPLSSTDPAPDSQSETADADAAAEAQAKLDPDYEDSNAAIYSDIDETGSQASSTHSEILPPETAGSRGGWEDAGWLLRTIRQALVST